MAMIAITTSSSMRVKAETLCRCDVICSPHSQLRVRQMIRIPTLEGGAALGKQLTKAQPCNVPVTKGYVLPRGMAGSGKLLHPSVGARDHVEVKARGFKPVLIDLALRLRKGVTHGDHLRR